MELTADDRRYRWIDEWVRMPEPATGSGRTHGVIVTEDGRVVIFHQEDPAVRIYAPDGTPVDAWGTQWMGAHGLTHVVENGDEYLWLTDVDSGRVEKTTLDGTTIQRLDPPDHVAYEDGTYSPSWVAVDEKHRGGTGDIWVTDGYGEFFVHRYTEDGKYQESFDGTEFGGPRYEYPHGLTFDDYGGQRRILLADAENQCVRAYDPDTTKEIETFGTGHLESPRGAARDGDMLVIPDLFANKVTLLREGELMGHLGSNPDVSNRDDYPDVSRGALETGEFNSPHDVAVGRKGVCMWWNGLRLDGS
jgi:hypothetical protein